MLNQPYATLLSNVTSFHLHDNPWCNRIKQTLAQHDKVSRAYDLLRLPFVPVGHASFDSQGECDSPWQPNCMTRERKNLKSSTQESRSEARVPIAVSSNGHVFPLQVSPTFPTARTGMKTSRDVMFDEAHFCNVGCVGMTLRLFNRELWQMLDGGTRSPHC